MTQKHIIKDDEFSREYWMHFPPLLSFSSSLSPFIYYLYINVRVYVFWINVTCSFVRHRSFNDTIRLYYSRHRSSEFFFTRVTKTFLDIKIEKTQSLKQIEIMIC